MGRALLEAPGSRMSAGMKIAHVLSDYLPQSRGGTQLHLRDLCRSLRALGHQSAIFAGERGSGREDFHVAQDEHDGVPVTRLTYEFRDFTRFDRLYVHPKVDAHFASWLVDTAPDVVHVHHISGLSSRIVELAQAQGCPVVLTLHDFWLVCPRGQRIHPETLQICEELDRETCLDCLAKLWPHLLPVEDDRPLARAHLERWENAMRAMLQRCQVLIAPSDFHRERFVEYGLDAERVVTVEHGLDKASLELAPRERPIRTLGFVGTALPTKGVHVLIEAFRILNRPELQLRIHGEVANFHGDTSFAERLRTASDGLDVRFEGGYEHEELPRILSELDLLVVPSIWWESFCLTIREGALAGLPVLASAHGAMGEAVDQGIARGFRPGDAQDLAQRLAELIEEAPAREELLAAAARVRSIADCAAETAKHYERALQTAAAST